MREREGGREGGGRQGERGREAGREGSRDERGRERGRGERERGSNTYFLSNVSSDHVRQEVGFAATPTPLHVKFLLEDVNRTFVVTLYCFDYFDL